jgi:hypothetical protein
LQERSGRTWNVTGGKGTAYGWITIDAPPKRKRFTVGGDIGGYNMSLEDRARLAELLGLPRPVHFQGESIPASSKYYAKYIDRAEGREPSVIGEQCGD